MTQASKLKAAIRARTVKTGESYTAARRNVLAAKPPLAKSAAATLKPVSEAKAVETPSPARDPRVPRGELSERTSRKSTGHGLEHWFEVLDQFGKKNGHTKAAEHLYTEYGVKEWHAQMITVTWERRRGLRQENQSCTGTFQVSLAYQPTANVAVSVTSNATGTAVVSLGSLTFTPANYATPQTVTVSGVEDADLTFDATTITLASAGITSATTSVTVTDNDLITATPLAATLCGGDTIDVNLHLLAKPYASVAVSASTGNVAVGTVSPLSHLYTTSNYATNQVYTITAKGGTTQKTTTITFDSTSQNPKVFNLTVLKNADCL